MKDRMLIAIAVALMSCLSAAVASAQQCGPRQVFDPTNVQLGQLACQSCQQGTARATAVADGGASDVGLAQAMQQIAELQGQLRALQAPRAYSTGGTPAGASAFAQAGGGAAVKPLYVVNAPSSGASASATATAAPQAFNELPPLALASLNTGNSATASASSGGCGGGGCGRAGILSRLGGRRSVSRSVAITRTSSR